MLQFGLVVFIILCSCNTRPTGTNEVSGISYWSNENLLVTVSDTDSTIVSLFTLDLKLVKEYHLESILPSSYGDLEGVIIEDSTDIAYILVETNPAIIKFNLSEDKVCSINDLDIPTGIPPGKRKIRGPQGICIIKYNNNRNKTFAIFNEHDGNIYYRKFEYPYLFELKIDLNFEGLAVGMSYYDNLVFILTETPNQMFIYNYDDSNGIINQPPKIVNLPNEDYKYDGLCVLNSSTESYDYDLYMVFDGTESSEIGVYKYSMKDGLLLCGYDYELLIAIIVVSIIFCVCCVCLIFSFVLVVFFIKSKSKLVTPPRQNKRVKLNEIKSNTNDFLDSSKKQKETESIEMEENEEIESKKEIETSEEMSTNENIVY